MIRSPSRVTLHAEDAVGRGVLRPDVDDVGRCVKLGHAFAPPAYGSAAESLGSLRLALASGFGARLLAGAIALRLDRCLRFDRHASTRSLRRLHAAA